MPLIHAAIVLAKSPERYGFTIDPSAGAGFERVAIEGAYDLRAIAECAGEPVEQHPRAQPGAAAPGDARRPDVRAARADRQRIAGRRVRRQSLPAEKRVNFRTHVVRRGQTLASIARANGVRRLATSPRPTVCRSESACGRGPS